MAKSKGKRITAKRVQETEHLPPPKAPGDVSLELKPEVDEDAWDSEGLTPRQRLFVEYLLGPAGGNRSKAAAMAGYAAENVNSLAATASRTLRIVKVREAVARRLAAVNITPEWIKSQAAALAASNMNTFMSVGDDDQPFIDWRQAETLGAFVQIRKYKEKGLKIPGAAGEAARVEVIERSIETHNPTPNLKLLAEMLGIVKSGGDGGTTVNVNVTQLSRDELVRIATRGGNRTAEA